MSRLIDADKLKKHYAWWNNEEKKVFDDIVDLQPTVDAESLITRHEDIGYERGYRDGYAEALEVTDNVEPMEFEWCTDCKEYDQEAHCCHRWTKVIRNTVNDLKTQGYEPVKHGYWIKNGDRYCECSVCHHEGNISGQDNYCWFCGAKMNVLDINVGKTEEVKECRD